MLDLSINNLNDSVINARFRRIAGVDMKIDSLIFSREIEINTWNSNWLFRYNEEGYFQFSVHSKFLNLRNDSFEWEVPVDAFFPRQVSPSFHIKNIKSVELFIDSKPVSVFKRVAIGTLFLGGLGAVTGALSTINAKPKSKISVFIHLDNLDLSLVNIPCKSVADAKYLINTISNLEFLINS